MLGDLIFANVNTPKKVVIVLGRKHTCYNPTRMQLNYIRQIKLAATYFNFIFQLILKLKKYWWSKQLPPLFYKYSWVIVAF